MIDGSPVSGDVATRQNPKPGDRVRIVFEAEWADEAEGYRVYDPDGGFKHTVPPSALVEVLERFDPSPKWSRSDESTWQELTVDSPEIAVKTAKSAGGRSRALSVTNAYEPGEDSMAQRLAEAARRNGVMVNVSFSPYDYEVDEE